MNIKVLKKSEVDLQRLAELAYIVRKVSHRLKANTTEDTILQSISEGITNDCYDLIFIAEDDGGVVGWLALYEITDSSYSQIWDWHPVVFPDENEGKIAHALIQAACAHLAEIGSHKVTIDFPANKETRSWLHKYCDWYSLVGISGTIEERAYKKNLDEGDFEVSMPDGYRVARISKTDLSDLFDCWLATFSSSRDQFFLELDAEGQQKFFFESWSREKPLIDEASLVLYHGDRLVGFSRLLPLYEFPDCCLAPIGIHPEYRRRGLAQALLKMSMLWLKRLNYQTVSVFVSTSNVAAISFYEKLGFVSEYGITSLFGEVSRL